MKKKLSMYYFLIIAVFVGYLLSVQVRASIPSYQGIITIPKILEMKNEIDNINIENQKLASAVNEAKIKLNNYEEGVNKTGNVYGNMKEELERTRNYADYLDLEGPGIIITLNDSLAEVGEDESLEWYIIHNGDVLEIVNELRAAGAEAISINDERVTATSGIICGGPTINVNGKRHSVPFVIKAIGNPQQLIATATAPEGYIDLMEFYDIRINIQKAEKITIKAYDGKYKLNYQKKSEGGE